MSNTITVRQGETLQIPVTIDDITAQTVQFKAWKENTVIIDETENFVVNGSQAEATIELVITDDADTYEYILIVTYSDGVIEKLPDVSECDGEDCGTPDFIICEAEPEA